MRLTQKDREILAALQERADEPIKTVAAAASTTEPSVRRLLSKGLASGQIRRRVYVNLFELGLQQYTIFFSIPPKSVSKKSKMREVLERAPFVELLIEVSGRYHFGLVLTVRSAFDLERFFDLVSTQSKIEVTDFALQVRTGWYYFGVKYLQKKTSPILFTCYRLGARRNSRKTKRAPYKVSPAAAMATVLGCPESCGYLPPPCSANLIV